MSICLIDTSVFVEILNVPEMNHRHSETLNSLRKLEREGVSFLLPLVTIIETGNHIGQIKDKIGNRRKAVAERFIKQVEACLNNKSPWKYASYLDDVQLREWLHEFPKHTSEGIGNSKGSGLGDLAIIKDFQIEKKKHYSRRYRRRVFIWSYDDHLQKYDTGA